MKIAAYTALCYGKPYLAHAMRSVIDEVDEYVVLYSDSGSHNGNRNQQKPPGEARSKLYSIAYGAAQDKLKWVDGDWRFEGQQRDSIWQHTDADVVVVVDYDEIWPAGVLQESLWLAARDQANVLLSLVHFWRSFEWAVTNDMAAPMRVILRGVDRKVHGGGRLLHFGYAIPDYLMRYKWSGIHGHQAELRRDIDWLEDRWALFSKRDVHPTNIDYWFPVPVDVVDLGGGIMRDHPFYGKEIIE